MSAKTSADVLIGGKIYTLSGYESEEYLQRVANYINGKINEFDEMEQFRRFPGEMKATLVELNIADDYFKAREQAEKLDQDVKEKDREIYELKHELISLRIKAESSEKTASELEKENRQLLLHKAKLENALEDALLGKVKGQVLPQGQSSGKQQPGQKKNSGNQPNGGASKEGQQDGIPAGQLSQEAGQKPSEGQKNRQMLSEGQGTGQKPSEGQKNRQMLSEGQGIGQNSGIGQGIGQNSGIGQGIGQNSGIGQEEGQASQETAQPPSSQRGKDWPGSGAGQSHPARQSFDSGEQPFSGQAQPTGQGFGSGNQPSSGQAQPAHQGPDTRNQSQRTGEHG